MSVYKVKPFLGDGGSSGGGSEIVDALPAQGVEGKTYLLRKVDESKVFKAHGYMPLLNRQIFTLVTNDFTYNDLEQRIADKLGIDLNNIPEDINVALDNFQVLTESEFADRYINPVIVTSLDEIPQTDPGVDVLQDLGEITMSDFKYLEDTYGHSEDHYNVEIWMPDPDSLIANNVINGNQMSFLNRSISYNENDELVIGDWEGADYTFNLVGRLTDEVILDYEAFAELNDDDAYYITLTPEQPTYSYAEYVYDQGVYTEISAKSEGGSVNTINLWDYKFNTACRNIISLEKINSESDYKLDVESLIQYVKDSGIGELPFEPNITTTNRNKLHLITNDMDESLGFDFIFYSNSSNYSTSTINIDFANQSIEIPYLINLEGDNFITFLERNKNAISEELVQINFYGGDIINTISGIGRDDICTCFLWLRTNNTNLYCSVNLTKFIDIFKEQ